MNPTKNEKKLKKELTNSLEHLVGSIISNTSLKEIVTISTDVLVKVDSELQFLRVNLLRDFLDKHLDDRRVKEFLKATSHLTITEGLYETRSEDSKYKNVKKETT